MSSYTTLQDRSEISDDLYTFLCVLQPQEQPKEEPKMQNE